MMDRMLHQHAHIIIDGAQALLNLTDGPLTEKQTRIVKTIIANAERFVHIYAEFQSVPFEVFAANKSMRHEMGTPLTPINGYAELLMMGALGALNTAQQHHVQRICESTNQLRLAVEMIVNEARLQMAALPTA